MQHNHPDHNNCGWIVRVLLSRCFHHWIEVSSRIRQATCKCISITFTVFGWVFSLVVLIDSGPPTFSLPNQQLFWYFLFAVAFVKALNRWWVGTDSDFLQQKLQANVFSVETLQLKRATKNTHAPNFALCPKETFLWLGFPLLQVKTKAALRSTSEKLISKMWCKILLNVICSTMVFITAILPVKDEDNSFFLSFNQILSTTVILLLAIQLLPHQLMKCCNSIEKETVLSLRCSRFCFRWIVTTWVARLYSVTLKVFLVPLPATIRRKSA